MEGTGTSRVYGRFAKCMGSFGIKTRREEASYEACV
jgi:hypothetical protein